MWSLGTLITFPIMAILIILFVIAGVWVRRFDLTTGELRVFRYGFWATAFIIAVLVASPVGMYPYKAAYHKYEPKAGVVADVNKRITGDSNSIDQKFVVRFAGHRQEYGCEDTRCAVIHKGDRVVLRCIKQWEYAGTDGFNCNFVRNEGNEG